VIAGQALRRSAAELAGPADALRSAALLPAGLLEGFAAPDARMCGHRVTEGSSGQACPSTPLRGGRRAGRQAAHDNCGQHPGHLRGWHGRRAHPRRETAAKMAMSFGLSSAARLVLSAILLANHKLLP